MSLLTLLLYGFEILAIVGAVGILLTKNVFHAALMLLVCLLALAGIFVMSHAEFIGVTQILMYAGGILVLILFGIMVTSRMGGKPLVVTNQYGWSGLLIGIFFSGLLIKLFSEQEFFQQSVSVQTSANPIHAIGISLMSEYVLAFEVAGVLLLIALLGAAVTVSSFNLVKNN